MFACRWNPNKMLREQLVEVICLVSASGPRKWVASCSLIRTSCAGTVLGRDCGGSKDRQGHSSAGGCRLAQNCLAAISALAKLSGKLAGRLVNSLVQTADQTAGGQLEDLTNSKKSRDSDRSAGLNLLPVPCRKVEGDHIFLAQSPGFLDFSDPAAKPGKQFSLICHLSVCRVPRAETPRAD